MPYPCLEFRCPQYYSILCCAIAMLLICSFASDSFALDGRIDTRAFRQGGRAGELAYTTRNLWESYSLDQNYQITGSILLQFQYSLQRERLRSETGGNATTSRKETQTPFIALNYRDRWLRMGLTGNGIRKDIFAPGLPTRRDENLTYSAWARTDISRASLSVQYQDTRLWRSQERAKAKNKNSVLGFIARVTLTDHDRLMYSVNKSNNVGITLGTESDYLSNILEYRGNYGFAQNRGKINIVTNASRFDQTTIFRIEGAREYLSPIWGGLQLDDTPQDYDPLEPNPMREPLLHDNDLQTRTMINIGSSASVVREFGGDYRNIILDFGDLAPMDSIALHIDAQIDFPSLIQWMVFVSDDPEGRDWGQALTSDQVSIRYEEWELGRQGWEVRFANPLTHRRVKMVNVKYGVTEPDIFITEMEVFSPPDRQRSETKTILYRYRLDGDIRYNILPNLEINYTTDIYTQKYDGAERDLEGSVHQAGAVWRPGKWDMTGYYQLSSLGGTSQLNTDANSQFLTLARRFNRKIDSRISWKRTEDNSYNLDYTTQDMTLDFNWRIAPALLFNQRIGRGERTDHQSTREAGSWVVISTIRSNPIRNLSLDIKHVDRWVSEDAGSGFTTFNNTELTTQWAILPLLAYNNQVVYQVRDKSDWMARNQISWNPLPGGTLGVSFNASDFRDTRIDIKQKSVGGNMNWRARSNARLEFGAEYVKVAQNGEYNHHYNLFFRGNMTF